MRHIVTISLILFTVIFLNPAPVFAQDRPLELHGAGTQSCGKYVQVYDAYRPFIDGNTDGITAWQATANYWQYEEWINGYIYGMDRSPSPPLRHWDRAGMQVWMYNYCQQHPVDLVANAALAFFKELGGKFK